MMRITQWEIKPHPTRGCMCLEGVVQVYKPRPHQKTIRTSRITGFGACDKGITVSTLSGQVYLLVGMSRPDLIRLAA